ncbi:MAG: hypothetical protein GXP28_08645 [Planctomycetes bacterium]|nr:hypothetical protein [Planctomycetota bacterium]
MHEEQFEPDSSVEWLLIEEPENPPKPSRKILPFLLIGGAFLLSSLTLFVVAKKLLRIAQSSDSKVTVSRIRDATELRKESVQAFREFDAAIDPLAELSLEAKQERLAIQEFLETLELCAQNEDNDRFVDLVDRYRLMKRMEITGRLAGYSNLEKRFLRSELKKSLDVKSYWSKLLVVKIFALKDDPASRIVYAYGSNAVSGDQYEMRFLIASEDNTWKLYDWQRMDLGVFVSKDWGLYAKYANTSLIEGYNRWADLLVEADTAMLEGENEKAQSKIRLAETQTAPRELISAGCLPAIVGRHSEKPTKQSAVFFESPVPRIPLGRTSA